MALNNPNPVMNFFDLRAAAIPGPRLGGYTEHASGPVKAPLPENVRALLAKPVSYFKEMAHSGAARGAPLTQVAFALDRSTSMGPYRDTVITGYNAQVEVTRLGAATVGETRFTEVQFDTRAVLRQLATSLDNVPALTLENYLPQGCTALYDALGLTIASLLDTEGIDNPNTACLVTLFTDGEDNSSVTYDPALLGQLVERLEATGRWTFALLGPKGSIDSLAQRLKVARSNVKAYDPASRASVQHAFASTAIAGSQYMSMRAMGATQASALYTSQD